jgi:hypothetical protein
LKASWKFGAPSLMRVFGRFPVIDLACAKTFHMAELEKVNLVEGKYGLSHDKRPVAVKYFRITPKGKEIYEHIVSSK